VATAISVLFENHDTLWRKEGSKKLAERVQKVLLIIQSICQAIYYYLK